jgi:hypothetical protein
LRAKKACAQKKLANAFAATWFCDTKAAASCRTKDIPLLQVNYRRSRAFRERN